MKAVITFVIGLAVSAVATPAMAQECGEGGIELCGFVWSDTNGDGIQNDDPDPVALDDQSGLSGVKVSLFVWDGSNNEWDFVTDTLTFEGRYEFDLEEGDEEGLYKIVVEAPTGTAATLQSQGGDNQTDSDGANDAGGSAVQVCLESFCPSAPSLPVVSSQDSDFGFKSNGVVAPPGTGTPGYWKNHPEAWPYSSIQIGGRTYTVLQAINLMGKVSKDKTVTLFSALVAAKLNVLIGNDDSCIAATIGAADAWMTTHPVGSTVAASSDAWQDISQEHTDLDDYNNGRLPCAQHRN